MKKKRNRNKKGSKTLSKNRDALDLWNIQNYLEDYTILAKYQWMPESTKNWIIDTRHDLQQNANMYERLVAKFLIDNRIHFSHQSPFVIDRKIYFLDFYIPSQRIAIEVDGVYHSSANQFAKDKDRETAFNIAGIKFVRITNEEAKNAQILKVILKAKHII